ncbi:unnamed protein product [Hermetia illucens]|uniref:Uncharacterized protein n=2 Tax=Hermetia illucens TaxID=343691 RepID=A0A7R8YS16_HERIL|nr:unnamed protein product [Hermetia illucens]
MATESAVIKKLKEDVGVAFEEVRKALSVREKLLLRQVDVIASQCQKQSNLNEDIKFIPNDEIDLMESIRSFGKFNLPHLNFTSDLYVSEDYICPSVDHETMYKCLNTKDEVDVCSQVGDQTGQSEENDPIDFFNDKILKENIDNMNESIVNITLKEAKDLIEKTNKNFADKIEGTEKHYISSENEEIVNDCLNGNTKIAQASQTEVVSSGDYKKPNITINNCNGIINLKNISNLTINCSGQTSIQTAQKADITTMAPGESTSSDIVSSTVQSDDEERNVETKEDNDSSSVNCEFYNRLIKEIKKSIKQHHQNSQKNLTDALGNHVCSSTSTESNGNDSYNRKLLLKNFENLKIVLENNENDTHPVQIEQWLTEIISETEIEPMQNTGILEHSKFAGSKLC